MTQSELAEHVYCRLAETATTILQGGALNDRQVATAFLAVAVTLAQHARGPAGVAEWLHGIADEIEGDPSLAN